MLTTGDAAPDIEKVVALLHFWGRRRVIGADRGDVREAFAELALFVARAKRRRAFGDGAELFHVLFVQDEIVRAGFASHIDPARPRIGDEGDATPATHRDDVQPAAGFRGQIDGVEDRYLLGG